MTKNQPSDSNIIIPYNFVARDYQIPFLREVERAIEGKSEKRFFYQIWHRRSGKDKTNIADVIPRRLIKEPCLVKYIYPTLVMGRDNLWDGMGSDGLRFIGHLPEQLRVGIPNQSRMIWFFKALEEINFVLRSLANI